MSKKKNNKGNNNTIWTSIAVAATLIPAAIYLYVDYKYPGTYEDDFFQKLHELVVYPLIASSIGLMVCSIAA